MLQNIIVLLEVFSGSGLAALITTLYTKRVSSKEKQAAAEPNGARVRLQDEVAWLRHQLDIERMRQ